MAQFSQANKQRRFLDTYANGTRDIATIIIQLKLLVLIAARNLPISLVDDLVPLLKSMFPNQSDLQRVTMARQKAGSILRQGMVLSLLVSFVCLIN